MTELAKFSRHDLTRTVHVRVRKTKDIEIHVSQVESPWGTLADIREYIVSLDQYGRGVTFPSALSPEILAGLEFFLEPTDADQ